MTSLFVAAGMLLTLSLIMREVQLLRERTHLVALLDDVRLQDQGTRDQARRLGEDLYLMQTLLAERNLLNEADMLRARSRLIDRPRRLTQEREAIHAHLGRHPSAVLLEESEGKVH
jgi:small-conductance mechanosensitive channel